jgi:hypothetical protein
MQLRWDAVTIDCRDPEVLAEFWSALLDVEVRGRWQQYVGLYPAAPGCSLRQIPQWPGNAPVCAGCRVRTQPTDASTVVLSNRADR